MSYIVLLSLSCIYCFSPSLSADRYCDCCRCFPPLIDYVVDDRIPTVELPGKQCPFTSPRYRLSFYNCLLHWELLLLHVKFLFLLHSLALSPLITFSYVLCSLIYKYIL